MLHHAWVVLFSISQSRRQNRLFSTLDVRVDEFKGKNYKINVLKFTFCIRTPIKNTISNEDEVFRNIQQLQKQIKNEKRNLSVEVIRHFPKKIKKSFFKISLEKLKDPFNVRKPFQKLLSQNWEQVQVELEAVKGKYF